MSEILCCTNPRSVDASSVGRSTIVGELTSGEIAALLHGESCGVYAMGMCYFADQYSVTSVSGYIYKAVRSGEIKIKKKREGEEKKPIYSRMCLLAVSEVVTGNICPSCRGRRFDEAQRPCVTCTGTGTLNPSDGWRSRYCYADDWKYWKPVYEKIYGIANDWLSDARRKLSEE